MASAASAASEGGATLQSIIVEMFNRRLHSCAEMLERSPRCEASRSDPTSTSVVELFASYAQKKARRMSMMQQTQSADDLRGRVILYVATQLEYGCRKVALRGASAHYTTAYSALAYSIADALRDPNCELLIAILSGRIHACRAASFDIQELCPSVLRAERDEVEIRKQQKIEQKTSSVHMCKKCGLRKTLVREMQTRSSDEAPTLAIQCVNCGYCWSQSG